MQAISHLTLNMAAPDAALVCYAVQNDKLSRYVVAELINGEQALVPESGTLYAIRYVKPDKTGGFYDTLEDGSPAVVANGSTLTIGYAAQVLTVPGDVYVQLQLLSGGGEVLTSFAWWLKVAPNVWTDDQVESSDYYSVLSQQIADVLGAAASLTGMTASATGRPAGSAPAVTVTGGQDGQPYNLAFQIPAGETGPAPTVSSTTVQYQASDNGTTVPTGTWSTSVPDVTPGGYLWTRARARFGTTWTSYWYSVSYRARNGEGAPSDATPLADSAEGSAGTSTDFSRADHRHPLTIPSEGGSGYVKLYDGTMIQWGRTSVNIPAGSTDASVSVTYPQAFHTSTGQPVVVVSTSETAGGTTTQTNVCVPTVTQANSLTSFTIRAWKQASVGANQNNPVPVIGWMAFGRWKE